MRVVGVLFLLPAMALGQAVVNESLETAFIYVNGSTGSDSNPGTQQAPLQTIGAGASIAISNNAAGIGTQINVYPGTYRESITLQGGYKVTNLPITLQAVTNGTVTVNGALQYTNWNVYSGNSNIYTSAWPNQWGFCTADSGGAPLEEPIVLRREEVLVNGALMTEVLDLTSMVFPGTFYVDETTGVMYLWPPSGTNLSASDVEVANQPTLLTIQNMNGVVVRGLNFSYASSCHGAASVVVNGSSNVLFDTAEFLWNGGQGAAINYPSSAITYMNSTANHNGSAGFQMFQVLDVLWQNDTASYNNWRGAQGAYYVWNAGGAHIFSDHDETYTNFTANYNQSFSIHYDTDNINITHSNMYASANLLGFFDEKNQGPMTVSGSTFCGALTGVTLRNSTNMTLTNDLFYNNSTSQIYVTGVPGGIMITDWATGQTLNLISSYLTNMNNVIDGTGANSDVFADSFLGGSDWNTFVTTLDSNNNDWWNPANPTPFSIPSPENSTALSFSGWQSATGQDSASTFSAPVVNPATACTVAVDAPDWWLTVTNLVNTPIGGTDIFTTDDAGNAVISLANVALGGWTGTVTFSVDGVSAISGATVTFSPATIGANGSTNLTFNAGSTTPAGTYTFVVLANSGSVTRTVTLTVTVPVSSVRLSTDVLNFGNEAVNFSSTPQTVTITNTGKTATGFTFAITYGYTQTNTCGTSLAAGKACKVTVTFKPTQVQTYDGALTITDSDPTSPQTVTLTGTGTGSAKIQLSVHSLAFGGVVFETPSKAMNVTVTNVGTAPLTLNPVTFTGADGSQLTSSSCTQSVPVNGTCTYAVVLTPTVVGSISATMNVSGNASNSPVTLNVTGNGLTAIKRSPSTINFGTVSVGKTGVAKVVTISNLSTASLALSPLRLTGANTGDFLLSLDTCGTSLPGLGSCNVTITFAPLAAGARAASLTITDGDPTSPQTVALSGTGK
jgi:hypothetical protein